MPGLAIAAASSAAWAEFGAQAERAWNTGWGFDQRADGAGGWTSNNSPTSSGFTFQSTGDATGYYLTGRGFKCVQAGGTTTYGTVGLSSFAGGITSVYVNQFSTQGSTVMSTGVITSVAVSPVILGFGGNLGGLVSIVPSTGGNSALVIGATVPASGVIRIPNNSQIVAATFAGGQQAIVSLTTSDEVQLAPGAGTVKYGADIYGPVGAVGMTVGFVYIASAAGAPVGAPAARTGQVATYYDATNNRFYVLSGGTWRSVVLA